MSGRNRLRGIARVARTITGFDLTLGPLARVPRQRFGSEYGGWWVRTDHLSGSSRVYSVGVGTDISFDVALIQHFGCEVFAFDPTPASVTWITSHSPPAAFRFHAIGIAAYDGTASFALRSNPTWASYEMNVSTKGAFHVVDCPVQRLASLMSKLRHDRLDVLKLDIEGAELDVIPDVLASSIDIEQILVEFHHKRTRRRSVQSAQQIVDQMRRAGYRPFALGPTGREISFTK
jgi:FkbM family methyltransferase